MPIRLMMRHPTTKLTMGQLTKKVSVALLTPAILMHLKPKQLLPARVPLTLTMLLVLLPRTQTHPPNAGAQGRCVCS
jgi:hypothetical protein